jgi:hypothetical protein
MMVSYFRNVTRSGYSAVVKEAMAMRDGHLQKRAGRDFVNNLAWMLAIFGSLGALLVFATQLPLLGVAAFVGIFAFVMAAIATVGLLWSGAYEDTPPGGGHSYPGPHHAGGGYWPGGGMVAEEETVAGEADKAAFAAVRNDP